MLSECSLFQNILWYSTNPSCDDVNDKMPTMT